MTMAAPPVLQPSIPLHSILFMALCWSSTAVGESRASVGAANTEWAAATSVDAATWEKTSSGSQRPGSCALEALLCLPGQSHFPDGQDDIAAWLQSSRRKARRRDSSMGSVLDANVSSALRYPWYTPRCKTALASCTNFPCSNNHGPTHCLADSSTGKRCFCMPGFCLNEAHVCVSALHSVRANIVPVSARSHLFPGGQRKLRTGLCASGGGGRALSFFSGILRGLTRLGLMSNVDVLSTVSGGSWASSIYMFANRTDSQLLGAYTIPEELTLDALRQVSSQIGLAQTRSTNLILFNMLSLKTPPDKVWQYMVGETFLEPFGLNSRAAYLAASAADVTRILKNNPRLSGATFYTPRSGRPKTYIIVGAALSPQGYRSSADSAVSFQISPDYIGSPYYPNGSAVEYPHLLSGRPRPRMLTRLVGGGFVEAFAFGGSGPLSPTQKIGNDAVMVSAPAVPFTLADAIGISSFGPAAQLDNTLLSFVNPTAPYWPVTSDSTRPEPAVNHAFGDGGNIDNSALLPQLQRGVERIVWVASSYKGLNEKYPWRRVCRRSASSGQFDPVLAGVLDQVIDKFGYGAQVTDGNDFLTNNKVFDNRELLPLSCRIWRLKQSGKPAVVHFRSNVLANPWWGIEGGTSVDVLLVYLEKVDDFIKRLPVETQNEIRRGSRGMFANFPIYHTMLQNPPELTSYTAPQVNLLMALGEYYVLHNQGILRRMMSHHGL